MPRIVNQQVHDMRRRWARELYKAHYTPKEAQQIIGCHYVIVTTLYREFKRLKIRKFDRSTLLSMPIQAKVEEVGIAA